MSDVSQFGAPLIRPGAKLGPYTIVAELGSGGMGAVYRARDGRLQRDVALKVIRAPYGSDAGRRRRFEIEARAAARIAHPNIVAIYDIGEENGTPYIVSEYISGGTLGSRIRGGSLPTGEAMNIAVAVAEALAEAHRNGIVHRDLKPENILLTAGGTPKISDFGLSKLLEPEVAAHADATTAVANLTSEGAIVGTPAYMAPEQASGHDVDFRCDQFSFAAVVLEMLSGKTPFRRPSVAQTLAAILHEEPDLTGVERMVPRGVAQVLRRCLSKDPRSRYASTDDLAHDLRHALNESPAAAQAGAKKRPAAAAAIAAVVVLAGIGAVLMSRHGAPASGPIASLAILPLQNFSGDRSQDYFADGLTEEITNQLASLRSLRVASRTSASAYRGTTKALSAVAQDLGVDGVIEGSVVRSGDQTRVTIQLIDGRTDRHVWSHSFERRAADILALQRDIAAEIADRIRVTLSPAEKVRMARLPTTNAAAYDAYLHATYKQQTAFGNDEDADAALRYAEQAVTLDSQFAEAYVAVAQACQAKIFGSGGGKEYDEKGFVAVEKALSLNPSLAEAYMARGSLQYNRWHGYDIAGAIADYRKAVALNPNLVAAHHFLGSELAHLGRHDEAAAEFRTALRLDPTMFGPKFRLGRALWQSNHFREALVTYERYGLEGMEKGVVLAYLGRMDDAWRSVAAGTPAPRGRLQPQQRGGSDMAAGRAFLYALEGKRAEAAEQRKRSEELGRDDAHFHHAAFVLAAACAELGDEQEAVRYLEFAAKTGMPNYPLFRDNPSMKKLHGKPRYEAFMSDLQLRWQQIAGPTQ